MTGSVNFPNYYFINNYSRKNSDVVLILIAYTYKCSFVTPHKNAFYDFNLFFIPLKKHLCIWQLRIAYVGVARFLIFIWHRFFNLFSRSKRFLSTSRLYAIFAYFFVTYLLRFRDDTRVSSIDQKKQQYTDSANKRKHQSIFCVKTSKSSKNPKLDR